MRKALSSIALLCLICGALTTGCGDRHAATRIKRPGFGTQILTSVTEYALVPFPANAPAGQVTFNIKNEGLNVHKLRVRGKGVNETSPEVPPETTVMFDLMLKPGSYTLSCPLDDHEDRGMRAEFTVK